MRILFELPSFCLAKPGRKLALSKSLIKEGIEIIMNAPCQYYRSLLTTYKPPHPPEDPSYHPAARLIEWCEHPRSIYPMKQPPERLPCGGDLKKCILSPERNRRKHPRFSSTLPIEYGRIDNPKNSPGHTTNISEGGLMASLPERIKVGEKLRLKIFFSVDRGLNASSGTGRIVWSNADIRKEGYYRHGLEFEDFSPQDLEKLRNFLRRFGDRY